jgi:hypothetical protein
MDALTIARQSRIGDSAARVARIRRRYPARFGQLAALRQLDELLGDSV